MAGTDPYRQTLGAQSPQPGGDDIYRLPFKSGLLGRPGFLHGGAIAGFLAIVCDAEAEAEDAPATTTMTFLRGGRERDAFACAIVRARTARLLVIEASAWQKSPDKPIALMSRTYLRA